MPYSRFSLFHSLPREAGACVRSGSWVVSGLMRFLGFACLLRAGLFLLLLLPFGVDADTDSSQEIGVPYLVESGGPENQVDGMALAPAGERLYVLRNSVLFQYELNPLSKINSVTLELNYDRDFIRDKNARIFISNDEKRLILHHPKKILLIDLDSRKIIKTLDYESQYGILNDEEFFTVKSDYTATVWRARDFEKLKEFNLDFRGADVFKGSTTFLFKINDKIILFQGFNDGVLSVLDSKTYKTSLVIHHVHDTSVVEISGDLNQLRINDEWDVDDRLTSTHKKVEGAKTFDLLTWSMTDGWHRDKNGWYPLSRICLQLSPTKKYFLAFIASSGMYYLTSPQGYGVRMVKVFHHFDDGEMIVFKPPYTAEKYFQATTNARKHMRMKDADGKIVPINDVTFDNYRKSSKAD